jgi:hypothetical protein
LAARLASAASGLVTRERAQGERQDYVGLSMWWDSYNLYRAEQFRDFWRKHLE